MSLFEANGSPNWEVTRWIIGAVAVFAFIIFAKIFLRKNATDDVKELIGILQSEEKSKSEKRKAAQKLIDRYLNDERFKDQIMFAISLYAPTMVNKAIDKIHPEKIGEEKQES